jgi:hypothetical protein
MMSTQLLRAGKLARPPVQQPLRQLLNQLPPVPLPLPSVLLPAHPQSEIGQVGH